MIVTKSAKIPLYPTKEQIELFHNMSFHYHTIGNKVVEIIKEKICSFKDSAIRRELKDYVENNDKYNLSFVITMIIKEKLLTFSKHGYKIRFKKFSQTYQRFPVRCDENGRRLSRIYSDDLDSIKIPSIFGKVKLSYNWVHNYIKKHSREELSILLNGKKQTARVTYDGKYWYLVFSYYAEMKVPALDSSKALGIDLGIRKLAVTSDEEYHVGVNSTDTIQKLEDKVKRLQRIQSRKERKAESKSKPSRNLKKIRALVYKYQRRINNIRNNEVQHISQGVANKLYHIISFEDLNIRGMLKNKHLSRVIQNQGWYYLYSTIKYKCEWLGEKVVQVDRFFSSSKICSRCSCKKYDLKLSDRVYRCSSCGLIIDRDYNAAINIRNEGIRLCNQ